MLSNISPALWLLTILWVLITAAVIAASVMVIRGRSKPKTSSGQTDSDAANQQAGPAQASVQPIPGNEGQDSERLDSESRSGSSELLSVRNNARPDYLPKAGSAEAVFFTCLREVVAEHLMVWRCTTPVGLHQHGEQGEKVPAVFSVQRHALDTPLFLLYFTDPVKLKAHEPQIDLLSREARRAKVPLLMVDESSDLDEDQLRTLLAQHVPARYLAGMEENDYDTATEALSAFNRTSASTHTQSGDHTQSIGEEKICPKCQSAMTRKLAKNGRYKGHRFWVCQRYPACRHVERIKTV